MRFHAAGDSSDDDDGEDDDVLPDSEPRYTWEAWQDSFNDHAAWDTAPPGPPARIEANVWASVVCLACQSATLPSCQDEPEGLAESSRCLLPHFVIHASAQVPLPLGFRPIQLRSRLRLLAQLRSSPCSGERARQLTTKPRDAMRPPGPPGRRPPCCFILTASCASSLVSALHRLPGIEENHPVGCNRRSRFVTVLHAMAPGPAMSCRLQCARPHERITGHGPKEVWQSQAAEFVFLLLA